MPKPRTCSQQRRTPRANNLILSYRNSEQRRIDQKVKRFNKLTTQALKLLREVRPVIININWCKRVDRLLKESNRG